MIFFKKKNKTMTNWEKYFSTPEKTSDTLERIGLHNLSICKDFCVFYEECNKESELIDNFDCCDGIKYFLQKDVKGTDKCQEIQ